MLIDLNKLIQSISNGDRRLRYTRPEEHETENAKPGEPGTDERIEYYRQLVENGKPLFE